jgi:hypothetical protein
MKRHINKVELFGKIHEIVKTVILKDGKRYTLCELLTEKICDTNSKIRVDKHTLLFWNAMSDRAKRFEKGTEISVQGHIHYNKDKTEIIVKLYENVEPDNNETEIIVNEFDEVLN